MSKDNKPFIKNKDDLFGDSEELMMVKRKSGEIEPVAQIITEDQETRQREAMESTMANYKFVVIFQDRYAEVSKVIIPVAARILATMMSRMKVGNRVFDFAYGDITKELGISVMSASRGINNLIDNKVVVKIMNRNRPVYLIDPSLCYKGRLHRHHKLVMDYERFIKGDQDESMEA